MRVDRKISIYFSLFYRFFVHGPCFALTSARQELPKRCIHIFCLKLYQQLSEWQWIIEYNIVSTHFQKYYLVFNLYFSAL